MGAEAETTLAGLLRAKAAECRLLASQTDGSISDGYLAKAIEWEALEHEVTAQDIAEPLPISPIDPKTFVSRLRR